MRVKQFGVYLCDENTKKIYSSQRNITKGKKYDYDDLILGWDESSRRFTGSVTYKIGKGTYYIRIERLVGVAQDGTGKIKIKASFPSSISTSSSSSSSSSTTTKSTGIAVPVRINSTLQLYALSSGSAVTATWSSSDKTVATVDSSGRVTGKKKGSAVITAKFGSTTSKIVVKVS